MARIFPINEILVRLSHGPCLAELIDRVVRMRLFCLVLRQMAIVASLVSGVMPICVDAQIVAALPVGASLTSAQAVSSDAAGTPDSGRTVREQSGGNVSGADDTPERISTGSSIRPQESDQLKGIALVWPVTGPVIETFRPGRTRGIEISGHAGDPVRAAAGGRVEYAGMGLHGYGSLVMVRHNIDLLTTYAHGRRLLVKTGDVVRQGQEIAEMGNLDDGRAAVLFEVRRDGKPVDPLRYLPRH